LADVIAVPCDDDQVGHVSKAFGLAKRTDQASKVLALDASSGEKERWTAESSLEDYHRVLSKGIVETIRMDLDRAYCELEHPLEDGELEKYVRKWLQRGEAHERYLGMNACRYNC